MLRSLSIDNFRSCAGTQLQLDTPLSAMVGRNGVGKTNILQALVWLARAATAQEQPDVMSDVPPSSSGVTASIEVDGRTYRYRLQNDSDVGEDFKVARFLTESVTVEDPEGEPRLVLDRIGEEIRSPLRPDVVSVRAVAPSLSAVASLLPDTDPLSIELEPLRRFLTGIRYYLLDDPAEGTMRDYVWEKDYVKWKQRYTSEGELTPSVALRLLYMWYEDRELLAEFQSLAGRDGLGLVDFRGITTVDVPSPAGQPRPSEPGSDKLHFFGFQPLEGMGGAGTGRQFRELSAGTRRAIRILVSLLFDRRSMMLIEEPEASIHPALLRKLVDILRSYSTDTQVLFTTHSAEVMDILRPEEILYVTAPRGRTEVRTLTEPEVEAAKTFMKNEGALSEFFETIDPYQP